MIVDVFVSECVVPRYKRFGVVWRCVVFVRRELCVCGGCEERS